MVVKVLDTSCTKCKALEQKARCITQENDLVMDIQKVTDINEIMTYNVITTPGLVINGEVKIPVESPAMNKY